MEGVGSRLGRTPSRYGPTPVFSGPVRKWKKQWVHVSSSSSTLSYQSNNGNGNKNTLLLCRWTPVTSTNSGDSDKNSVTPEERPRRKFRYTPIVVLEEKKKEVFEKATDDESKARPTSQSTAREASQSDDKFEKPAIDNVSMDETQASNKSRLAPEHPNKNQMGLDLCLKGHDDNQDSDGGNKEAKLGKGRPDAHWALD